MIKFEVATPLGFTVRTTASYWKLLLLKHPEIEGRERDIERTLAEPDVVRRSRRDPAVHLFYRAEGAYHLCAVVKRLGGDGFLVTAYVTDTVKEGERLWPTSA